MDCIELNSEYDQLEDLVNIDRSPFPVRELTIYTRAFTNNCMNLIEVLAPNLEVLNICRNRHRWFVFLIGYLSIEPEIK